MGISHLLVSGLLRGKFFAWAVHLLHPQEAGTSRASHIATLVPPSKCQSKLWFQKNGLERHSCFPQTRSTKWWVNTGWRKNVEYSIYLRIFFRLFNKKCSRLIRSSGYVFVWVLGLLDPWSLCCPFVLYKSPRHYRTLRWDVLPIFLKNAFIPCHLALGYMTRLGKG